MDYRWLTDEEIEKYINPICEARGWMQLNLHPQFPTCRVLGAIEAGMLEGFCVLQLVPSVGPLWVSPDHRDGQISRELVEQVHAYLEDQEARGYMVIAESPVTERMAKRYGMTKLEHPVYIG